MDGVAGLAQRHTSPAEVSDRLWREGSSGAAPSRHLLPDDGVIGIIVTGTLATTNPATGVASINVIVS